MNFSTRDSEFSLLVLLKVTLVDGGGVKVMLERMRGQERQERKMKLCWSPNWSRRKLRRAVKAELPAATNPLTDPRCFLKYKPEV